MLEEQFNKESITLSKIYVHRNILQAANITIYASWIGDDAIGDGSIVTSG